jgi:DNA recombination-dependent growth factor C
MKKQDTRKNVKMTLEDHSTLWKLSMFLHKPMCAVLSEALTLKLKFEVDKLRDKAKEQLKEERLRQ